MIILNDPAFYLFSLQRVSLDTWTFQLLTSTCPPNLKGFFKWHTHMHICMHRYTHAHPHSETHTHTNTNARSIERLAQRSCQCGFIFLLIDTSCETLRHAHMCTCIQSDCTCHLSWIVLPLPHFVLPVHHLYSSSAVSSMGSCETLLSVCVWKVFRPAAWRRSAHPPLSCLAVGQLRWYTVFASGCVCLSVCVGKCIHCR